MEQGNIKQIKRKWKIIFLKNYYMRLTIHGNIRVHLLNGQENNRTSFLIFVPD